MVAVHPSDLLACVMSSTEGPWGGFGYKIWQFESF